MEPAHAKRGQVPITMAVLPTSLRNYLPAITWAAFILFATIANVSTLTSLQLQELFAFDKPIHMVLFGTQAGLLIRGFTRTQPLQHKFVYKACLASVLYGIATEVLQGVLTTSRFFDYFDMIANTIGCALVLVFYLRRLRIATS